MDVMNSVKAVVPIRQVLATTLAAIAVTAIAPAGKRREIVDAAIAIRH
jgi:hypothetical protein